MTSIQLAVSYLRSNFTLPAPVKTSWIRWAGSAGVVSLALFAVNRVRSHINSLPDHREQPVKLFLQLIGFKNTWLYRTKWEALKTHLSTEATGKTFFEAVMKLQIEQPGKDFLTSAFELIPLETLRQIYNINKVQDLTQYSENLTQALQNPPQGDGVVHHVRALVAAIFLYLSRASNSFITTYLRAHNFEEKETSSLVSRSEAMMHLSSFYEIVEKPIIYIAAIFTFLKSKTDSKIVHFGGSVSLVLAALSLLRILHIVDKKKDTSLNNDMRNLSADYRAGKLPFITGRSDEVAKIVNCFSPLNSDSLSVLLVGPSGVGKDAIVFRLIEGIEEKLFLNDVDVLTVGTSELSEPGGGTNHTYLTRLQILTRDLRGKGYTKVLFCNEIHTLKTRKEGWGATLGEDFKTFLETGLIPVIGATTKIEYKKYLKPDQALMRRFNIIKVKPLSEPECIESLKNFLARQYPNVSVAEEAIKEAVAITNKTDRDVAQPAKAKKLLIEAVRSEINKQEGHDKNILSDIERYNILKIALNANPSQAKEAQEAANLAAKIEAVKKTVEEKKNNAFVKFKRFQSEMNERLIHHAYRFTSSKKKEYLPKIEQLQFISEYLKTTAKPPASVTVETVRAIADQVRRADLNKIRKEACIAKIESQLKDEKLGTAEDTGDCFYDAMRKALKLHGIITTVQSLRNDVAEEVEKSPTWKQHIMDKLKGDARGAEEIDSIDTYLSRVRQPHDPNKPAPIWGDAEREGPILCKKYNVNLRLITAGVIESTIESDSDLKMNKNLKKQGSPVPDLDQSIQKRYVELYSNPDNYYFEDKMVIKGAPKTCTLALYPHHYVPVIPNKHPAH